MKAYGLPRWIDLEFPDCADIRIYGLKSAYGKHVKTKNKRSSRRIWKKAARREGKVKI